MKKNHKTSLGTPLPPQHNFANKECPITDLWPSETNVCDCPSPADMERWEEEFDRTFPVLDIGWSGAVVNGEILGARDSMKHFIRTRLHSAEDKGWNDHEKQWKHEVAEEVSQREDEILRDMRREVVDEFEELMLSFHAAEEHGQKVTQTWTNIISRLTTIIKKRETV